MTVELSVLLRCWLGESKGILPIKTYISNAYYQGRPAIPELHLDSGR